MAYRLEWVKTIPMLEGDDDDVMVWLLRESAERKAAGYLLEVTEFTDLGEVPADDIPPLGIKQLGPTYQGCRFRRFRIVAERPPSA